MDDLIKTVEKHRALFVMAIAVLMFVLVGFCSAVDAAGKAQAGGFKVLFEGRGLGFSRFLSALILIAPILIVAGKFVNFKLSASIKENFDALCFIAGFILCLIFAMALPNGISLAWGGWLYVILAVFGTAVSCLDKIVKK